MAAAIVKTVILATSWAPLLSGLLHQCATADDPTCSGGVAAFRAMLRHHRGDDDDGIIPAVHLQLLDRNNAFVHMHPLGLAVNRLILNGLMGLDVFASSPSILLQNRLDYDVSSQDLSYLQTRDMPLLLTNVGVPPQNSWHPFTEAVHFDEGTGLAVLSVSKSLEELNVPQIESALGSLRYVRKVNEENGCTSSSSSTQSGNSFSKYSQLMSTVTGANGTTSDLSESVDDQSPQCWLPVVYHSDDGDQFVEFLMGMLELPTEHRPAMIIDTGGNFEEYATPKLVDGVWIASHGWNSRTYFHHELIISYGRDSGVPKLDGVEFVSAPLSPLPEEAKDEVYGSEIVALREAADEALKNNPVVGYSESMPVTRGASKYRPCKSGECPIGNLFTDAARWYANADVAFITSGGVRGPGWPAGEVTVSDVWAALPFPNSLCTGFINGVHLFQLLNYSLSVATFEGHDTDDGGRLVQLSGMRVRYNTELGPSRVLSIDIRDRGSDRFEPIDRLRVYKFATDSYLCGVYAPYPSLLGGDSLVVEGERPGKIESVLFQEMLAGFLKNNTNIYAAYNTETQDRLMNDTSATEVLDLIQTEDSCEPGAFWKADIETCLSCPVNFDVAFSKRAIEFEVVSQREPQADTIILKNHEHFGVAVIPKRLPKWLKFDPVDNESPTSLVPGESLPLSMEVDPADLEQGTFHITIGFGVLDGGEYPGCVGQDATFDITLKVYPTEQKNQLGSISAVGFTLFAIIAFTSIAFATFVYCNRQQQVVRALQPIFLGTISFGVLTMGGAIIPLSIDDEKATQRGCDIKCMALPWLLCLGFSIAMSALFAKLLRINKLFNPRNSLRRVTVRAKDVATPLLVMFLLNTIVLLIWSILEPLEWQRFEVNDEAWNTYGICVGSNQSIYYAALGTLNVGALILALVQAWRARNISDEYSETKTVGVALYSWLQLLLVGVPALLLIDKDNSKARYFLLVALLFLVCMSMLLIIFIPMVQQIRLAQIKRKVQMDRAGNSDRSSRSSALSNRGARDAQTSGGLVRISGLHFNPSQRKETHHCNGLGKQEREGNRQESSDAPSPVQLGGSNESSAVHSYV